MGVRDDLGAEVPLSGVPERVVSLVPSLSEAIALSSPQLLVGCTDWCSHPADLDVARVRGTKNPDLDAIVALEPDLVVASKEENRAIDVQRLRDRGLSVWVTDIVDIPSALASMDRLLAAVNPGPAPAWLIEARSLWSTPPLEPGQNCRVAVPIWRDPWMVVGGATYTNDLLSRLGLFNLYAEQPRYPRVQLDELDRVDADLVLLPDEPYAFTEEDGPEAFTRAHTALVPGRLLTWYGPAMVEAWHYLTGSSFALRLAR